MKLEPPDLSSFIKTRLSAWSAKHEVSPSNSAGTSSHPLSLLKSTNNANQFSLSGIPVQGQNDYSPLKQSSSQLMPLIQQLGLPQDTLSSSIVSFFRFFSLPLDARVLKQVRREVLDGKSPNGKSSDAAALAASAAFDKGVTLSDEALKEYAAAIDPGERNGSHEQSSQEHNEHRGGNQGAFQDNASGSGQAGQDHQQKKNTEENNTPLPEDMKNLMNEIDGNGSVLGYLNKIPGKNSSKWIILPFNFTSSGTEFRVSLRILLNTDDIYHIVDRLAVDVHSDTRCWLFLIAKGTDNTYNAQITTSPNLAKSEESALMAELREIFGNFVSRISFIDENDLLSFMDSRSNAIISVDEEV